MHKYGQYCPVAMATEILGDRWTLLIVRDLLSGIKHFNDLERGLPGISRGLLAERLRRLESAGVLEKLSHGKGKKTEYQLTAAGAELHEVINALMVWGARWAFDEPTEEQLDPVLLMWWMRNRIRKDQLPGEQVVIEYNFIHRKSETFWLILKPEDVSVCVTYPGFAPDVYVTAKLSAFFKIWLGRISFDQALASDSVQIDASQRYIHAFPNWFAWSLAAPAVRAELARKTG